MSETTTPTPTRTPLRPVNGDGASKPRRFGGFKPSKRDQNLGKMETFDKAFKGANEDFGIVIGLSNELPHLVNGKVSSEFQEALLIYVQSKYDRGADLRPLILHLKNPKTKLEDKKPPYNVSEGSKDEKEQMKKWEMKWKSYVGRMETLEENSEKLFGLIIGQCTHALLAEIKASPDYEIKAEDSDSLWLMKQVKHLSIGVDGQHLSIGVDGQVNKFLTYHEKLADLFRVVQGPVESLEDYRTRFTAAVMTVEMTGGQTVFQPYLGGTTATTTDIATTKDKLLAMWFLLHADKVRFGPFLSRLKESDIVGKDQYPETLTAAFNALLCIEKN